MFEFLSDAEPTQALSGVHFAIRRINFRGAQGESSLPPATAEAAPLTPEAKLGLKIIEEIERAEHAPLQNLSDTKAQQYVRSLGELVQNLSRGKFDYEKNQGRDLLKKWDEDPILKAPPLLPFLSGGRLALLAAYLVAMTLLPAFLLLKLWPTVDPSGAWSARVIVFGLVTSLDLEARLILLALLAGWLGSCIHTLRSFADYVGNRRLISSWVVWYAVNPFIGMAMAVVFYFLIRATTILGSPPQTATRFFWVLAFSGLVGMFSKQLGDKLSEVFSVLFRPARGRGDAKRSDMLSWPTPVVTSVSPDRGPTAGGTPVVIGGRGLTEGARVTFGGAPAVSVTRRADGSLSALTPPHAAGAVDVAVISPDGQQAVQAGSYTFEE